VEPIVSVLLPARDAAPTLPACLRSIRRQTLEAWECIVVDDDSRDETGAIARATAATDPRVRVVAGPGRGIVAALQTGLAACRGRYVARMDADDLMRRARLARQVAMLAADDALAAVGTHVRFFPRTGMRDGLRTYEAWLNGLATPDAVARDAWIECPLAHPTLCLRRAVLADVGYREVAWPEDYDLVLRLFAAGHRLGVVPARLVAWRDGAARLSRTDPRYGIDRFVACKAAHLATTFLAGADGYILWGYGDTGRALGQALASLGKRPTRVVELHPGRVGNRILGAPTIRPEALEDVARGRLVASVAGPGPREEIRAFLAALGWREGRDFVCAA
jgi:glycosyltransferase involved in cell wall biosynthesis